MSLKLKTSYKAILKWVAIGLAVLFVLVFFIRTAVWENDYYARMEGSERAGSSETVEEEEELVEEEPTEEEVTEYIVAEDRPRYITIEKIDVKNRRILAVGINSKGELATPTNIFDTGWYTGSGKPGEGKTMLIDGHNGGPHVYGVFKRLPELTTGDIITIERGDGTIFNYSVMENVEVPLSESDVYMATAMRSPEKGRESLTLITCTGEWSQAQRTYLSRQFVRAVLVS